MEAYKEAALRELVISLFDRNGEWWSNTVLIKDQKYSLNLWTDDIYLYLDAYPVIPNGNYEKENTDLGFAHRILEIKLRDK